MSIPKNLPEVGLKKQKIAAMIRVNHAGEYGAKRIYEGQLRVIRNSEFYNKIYYMYAQEQKHLTYFQQQIVELKIRPTLLQPLWWSLGFGLGAVSAVLGNEAAMACTVAVEDVIVQHYQHQLTILSNDDSEQELYNNIAKFCNEELEHRDEGIAAGAETAIAYQLLYKVIQTFTKSAIWLSQRI